MSWLSDAGEKRWNLPAEADGSVAGRTQNGGGNIRESSKSPAAYGIAVGALCFAGFYETDSSPDIVSLHIARHPDA